MTSTPRAGSPWARWSLARQLPVLTAAIIVLMMALTLTLTYRALVQTRSESLHDRLEALQRTLVASGENSSRARVALLRELATDSALHRALIAPAGALPSMVDAAALVALGKVSIPTDSGLPVELWTTDGRRVAHIGRDIRDDSVAALPPELRSRKGTRVSEVPAGTDGTDSVQLGALYPSGGRVYFWAIVPVLDGGKRLGYIAQQRRIVPSAAVGRTVRDLSGEDVTVYLRNATDDFWATVDGTPAVAPLTRDTTASGFIATRAGGERRVGTEGHVGGTPYIFTLEAPEGSIVTQPRATLRRIAVLCVLILFGGIALSWALSRQVTRPLVELTTAAEAIAHGDYARRVESRRATSDEVQRLGTSFNRMASAVEASQHELASQVEEAHATSEELEQTNVQLQHASTIADEARDAALDANRVKSDFLAVMSHELRTPLNAIGGYAEILQLGIYGEVSESQRDALLRISRSQQTLLALINDVLNFAKLEAGEVHYAMANVPIASTLLAMEDFVGPQLRVRNLAYVVHPCDLAVTVRADADKLQQILINLLSNAIKYTSEGGTIDVACAMDGDKVHVRVHDTGIGIAADRLVKIFDPFIQVGRALNRPHEGVGLGLSISRDLASAMGATLSVESVVGKGSTFTVTLERGEPSAHSGALLG